MSSPPPLTTLFVPPNSCFTDVYWYSYTSGESPQPAGPTLLAGDVFYLGLPGSSNCLPTSWEPSSYYSPGICPRGYTIACSSFNSVETVTETIATCCPSNYVCLSQSNPADEVQSTEQCYTFFTAAYIFSGIISAGGSTTLSGRSVIPGQGINAYSVQVRWQSTDIEIISLLTPTQSFPSSASSTVSPASSLSSATTASNTSSITASPTPSQPSSLTIGAKIAIGVTIPIVFFALLLGFFLFWQKRRSKSRTAPIATIIDPSTRETWWKPELDAEGTAKKSHSQPTAAELDTATPEACRDL